MKLFDTHAHFSRLGGEYTLQAQVDRANAAGVQQIVAVGGDCELNKAAADAATAYPDKISVALGYDRDQAEEYAPPEARQDALYRLGLSISQLPSRGIHVCGIGEIGLDYHYSADTAAKQVALFEAQLAMANELNLPVVVHSREADDDTITALANHARAWKGDPARLGVLHCFTGGEAFAAKLVELGYYISFSGILTFLNADPLRAVAKSVPEDKLLIETDSPFLAPAPMRGKRNEPAFVKHVAERLAEVRGVSADEIADLTFENATRLFEATLI
jgi:TatD DNase family protein